MGYYTRFELSIVEGDDFKTDYATEIAEAAGYCSLFSGGDSVKWYNHQTDMVEYSKKHLNVLFLLEGVGEEDGDIWREYYKNGLMQRIKAEINFDDFDETKME